MQSTPGRRLSKTLLTIDEQGSKLDRNSVFLLPFVSSQAINGNRKLSKTNFIYDSRQYKSFRLTPIQCVIIFKISKFVKFQASSWGGGGGQNAEYLQLRLLWR